MATKVKKNPKSKSVIKRNIAKIAAADLNAESNHKFGSKLGPNVGKQIEARYVKGESLHEIAKSMNVSINTVRYRFLSFLLTETYDFS